MFRTLSFSFLSLCALISATAPAEGKEAATIPTVAIANYGPHSSLEEVVQGFKEELAREGFVEGNTVRYELSDVQFDQTLIPQMMARLKATRPALVFSLATPVTQVARRVFKDTPVVFGAITDPVAVGFLHNEETSYDYLTGASDRQDLALLLSFASRLIPNAKRVGVLYATSDDNDAALVAMMQRAAAAQGFTVVAVPVDSARDVPLRVQGLRGRVDFLYVGTSGPIQPSLPAIAAVAAQIALPVFNADKEAVSAGLALGSFAVTYHRVGVNAGRIAARILRGESVSEISPVFPTARDHQAFVNKTVARRLGLSLPKDLDAVVVE